MNDYELVEFRCQEVIPWEAGKLSHQCVVPQALQVGLWQLVKFQPFCFVFFDFWFCCLFFNNAKSMLLAISIKNGGLRLHLLADVEGVALALARYVDV